MSIEQKIAEMLAESKNKQAELVEEVEELVVEEEVIEEEEELEEGIGDVAQKAVNVVKKIAGVATGTVGAVTGALDGAVKGARRNYAATNEESTLDVADDVAALVNGEDLSEEFKTKAATIFEAAIVARVKQEVANLEEEFDAKLEEAVAQNQEGLVEKVDGYLNYVVETWIAQNEIALERGMKSDILENFVSGLKDLFVESWIDVPEEKYDVLTDMETQVSELQAKLDEQLAVNVEMNKIITEQARVDIIKDACNGLTDTEVEKFTGLAEELAFEDADTFAAKVQTIRENYFTNKAGKSLVESVVTDTPVESLTEEKVIDPSMKRYMNALNNVK